MTAPVLAYLAEACVHAGLPRTRVLVRRSREEAYRTVPAALLALTSGNLRRDGSRVQAGPERTTRTLYRGLVRARLELYARSQEELDRLLVGVLLYLWHTPLEAGGSYQAKLDEISLSYQDEEGFLLPENGLALEIPVEVYLLEGVDWVPVAVEVEGLVEEV
jgi:hypothetical protein